MQLSLGFSMWPLDLQVKWNVNCFWPTILDIYSEKKFDGLLMQVINVKRMLAKFIGQPFERAEKLTADS